MSLLNRIAKNRLVLQVAVVMAVYVVVFIGAWLFVAFVL